LSEHSQTPHSSSARTHDDGDSWSEDPTAEHTSASLGGPASPPPAVSESGDTDEEWVTRSTHGIRLGMPAAALVAVVLIAAGFWGGAELEKNHSSGATNSLASLAARFRPGPASAGATGSSGAPFAGFPGSTAAATGTVSVVDGDSLYVRTSAGSLVKVTLTKSTTVTRNASASAGGLRPGDTVVVQGSTTKNTVAASSVSATAPGVSSGFGGLGGGTGTGGSSTSNSSGASTTRPLFGG
jgi:endonuclease YncB( thermonuclease family)